MGRLKRSLRRFGIGCAIAAPILGVVVLIWYRSAYVLPPEPIRAVELPRPNGYDTLLAATNLLTKEVDGVSVDGPGPGATPTPFPLAARKKLLAANLPAIEKVREARLQEYLTPRFTNAESDYKPYAKFRQLARMLRFAAQTDMDLDYPREAVDRGADAVEIGVDIPRGGVLITELVGVACEAIGQRALWDVADRLDAGAARYAAGRLEQIEKRRWSFAQTLREEKGFTRASIRKLFAGGPLRSWRGVGESLGEGMELPDGMEAEAEERGPMERGQEWAVATWTKSKILYYGPRTTLENLDRWIEALAARSETPWSNPRPTPPLPDDPMSQIIAPVFSQAEYKSVMIRASAALLRTSLALRAHRLEKGVYPESLDALVKGGYLAEMPRDAFSPTRSPLGYRREGADKMTLWSVGPDAKDDGGRAIDNGGKRGSVEQNQAGDMVARVNTW